MATDTPEIRDAVARVGAAIQIAWNNACDAGLPDLPPIDLTTDERDHLAQAAIAAFEQGSHP